ncbi:MAG: decaprenyl-phosphate phosphoribosyltransferase, partial [Chloroflexi bacterium]|nr:decaprenyl-phosphate phosphoribosyltransferase [Chloroflexota bacterium]
MIPPMFMPLLKTMRPKQWAKNGFLFAGLFFDKQLTNPEAFLSTLAGFAIFCILASSIYLINDLSDL